MNRLYFAIAASLLALLLFSPSAGAQSPLSPEVLKLHSQGTGDNEQNFFGTSVAVSDTWMVVGEPLTNDISISGEAPAVYVYSAITGRFIHQLNPVPAPWSDSGFGESVAISGPLALIGASKESSGRGAAYVFDLQTGRQLARLTAPDGLQSQFTNLGRSVALNGNLALIGAPGRSIFAIGSVFLFHARTGAQIAKLSASNGAIFDEFGISVALSETLAVVGTNRAAAYTYDVSGAFLPNPVFPELAILTANGGSNFEPIGNAVSLSGHRALIGAAKTDTSRGAAYLFDARTTTNTPLRKFVLTDAAAGDRFGDAVSLNGNLAVIGAGGRSTALIYDASTGEEVARLTPPDATGNGFGKSLAVSGNQVLVGASGDDDLATDAGAAYLFSPVSVPLPLTAVAKVGDFAPGTVKTNFAGFFNAYLNDEAEVGLSAALSNRSRGVWSDYAGPLRPALRIGDDLSGPLGLPGVSAAGYGKIIPEDLNGLLVQTFLRGPRFRRGNNLAWLRHTGLVTIPILRQGETFAELTGAPAFLGFPEVVQRAGSGHVLAGYTLARRTMTGTTAANDSGVTYRDENGATIGTVESDTRHREGSAPPTGTVGDTYRQFFGRVALSPTNTFFAFPAYYLDTSPADPLPDVIRQGLFYDRVDTNEPDLAARQEQTAVLPGDPAVTFRAFLGETVGNVNATFRALITGEGITRANDEGIFLEGDLRPYLWKGQAIDTVNAPGVVISRFLGYWPAKGGGEIIALVRLRGPGVTRPNDSAVVLAGHGGGTPTLQILLREGDLVGADASRVATIQRVDVDSVNGHYHILASLTGSKARNQALFQGNAELGPNDAIKVRNLPAMVLRKGQGYQQPTGETSTIKTLTMPVSTDRTGAGAKGHGQAINNAGEVVVTLEFTNRSREVWKGRP